MKPPEIMTIAHGDRELVVWCHYSGVTCEEAIKVQSRLMAAKLMENLEGVLAEAWAANNIPSSRTDAMEFDLILAMIDATEPVLYLTERQGTADEVLHIYLDENAHYTASEVIPN